MIDKKNKQIDVKETQIEKKSSGAVIYLGPTLMAGILLIHGTVFSDKPKIAIAPESGINNFFIPLKELAYAKEQLKNANSELSIKYNTILKEVK